MPSKMVIDRQRSSAIVEQAAEVFGPKAAEKLVPLLSAGLDPGEEPPDLLRPTLLLGKALGRSRQRMVQADVEHDDGRRSDLVLRTRRDLALAELRSRLLETRAVLDASFGVGGASTQAGIDELPAVEPVGLLRQADDVLRKLQQSNSLVARNSPRTGVSLDRAAMVEVVSSPRQALVEALGGLVAERRKLILSFAAKTEAIGEYDATFGQVARVLESLFQAAGMPLVAARVRPSSRRPGRTDAEVETPGDDLPLPDGSEEPEGGEGAVAGGTGGPAAEPPVGTGAPS